jgi:hypothetical protein
MHERGMSKSANGWKFLYVVLAGLVFLVGCGAGKTLVMSPPDTKVQVTSIEVFEGKSTVKVPDEVKKTFHDKLQELLYEDGTFHKGTDLKLRYRFIQFNPGNQFTRWFWGGIGNAGEGALTIEVKYLSATDAELATIQSEGKIGSGAFGGSFNFAVGKAAKEIAEYTKQNFR